jgi:AraC-like DNA-binding protein
MEERSETGHNTPNIGHGALMASLLAFDPDEMECPVVSLRVKIEGVRQSVPMHQHIRGQLTLASRGSVICELNKGIWLVPSDAALWIPGGMAHATFAEPDSFVTYVYIDSAVAEMPTEPGTLQMTLLVRELVQHFATIQPDYVEKSAEGRLAQVLLDQVSALPFEQLFMPLPRNERLRLIVHEISQRPDNRNTITEWADKLALSEKSLRRLVLRETGMTFGRWRQQFSLMAAIDELSKGRSVDAVATQLGYKSTSAFTLMFKRTFGKAPKAYMRGRTGRG